MQGSHTHWTTLTDDELAARRRSAIERLKASGSVDDAQVAYAGEVFPAEVESMRREGARRSRLALHFVTVGAQPETPQLAVLAAPADHVILLHTEGPEGSEKHADRVIERLGLSAVQARKCSIGNGTNALVLYQRIFEEWDRQGRPNRVAIDLTGGFKTMSAAAAVAGFALPGAEVSYIEAEQPRVHKQVFWVNEQRITLDNPFDVFGEIPRQAANALFRQRRWGPAAEGYRELHDRTRDVRDDLRARLAAAYLAIESLDFAAAEQELAGVEATEQAALRARHEIEVPDGV